MTESDLQKELSAFISHWEVEERAARFFSACEVPGDKEYLLGKADAIRDILEIFKAWKDQ